MSLTDKRKPTANEYWTLNEETLRNLLDRGELSLWRRDSSYILNWFPSVSEVSAKNSSFIYYDRVSRVFFYKTKESKEPVK